MPRSSPLARTLTDLVSALGSGLAELLEGRGSTEVDDITLAEAAVGVLGVPGDILLGVGIVDADSARSLVTTAAERGVAAVALRWSLASRGEVRAAAREGGTPLVAVSDDASWAHVAWLLREVLDRSAGDRETSLVADELFTLADACAALLGGAPVTIEDTSSRVLAYSGAADLTDPVRVTTIIGRRVPAAAVAALRARGVFRHLVRSSEPLFLPAARDGSLRARLVVPVRAGEEWVGSIWAIVDAPPPAHLLRPLRETAALVALHLLRLRSESDLTRRLVADQLQAALSGEATAASAVLPPPPWRVVVLGGDPSAPSVQARQALWESICRRASWQRPTLISVDDEIVAIVVDRPETAGHPSPGTWSWLRRLVEQVSASGPWAWAAAGPAVTTPVELGTSLTTAREVVRLRTTTAARNPTLGGPTSLRAVSTVEEEWAGLVVARAVEAVSVGSHASGSGVDTDEVGPVADGTALDRSLAATLLAWLDHAGDLRASAARLHVHPNTVRYRLGRVRAELGVDLTDPTVRLALTLQLRAALT